MSLLSNGKYNQGSGKIYSSKSVQEGANDDDRQHKISITDLPCDCLNLIFKCLETRDDCNSFGLTCHQWLHIQNINHEYLWYLYGYGSDKFPEISREIIRNNSREITIVSGGGLEELILAPAYGWVDGREDSIDSEAVVTIAKGCPLLKTLILPNCDELGLEGWEAIGRYCKNMKSLYVRGCRSLCDLGLQALSNGCNKHSSLVLYLENCCSSSALEVFKLEKPGVLVLRER
ncbi:hypothetical protein MKW94_020368 [Papaver nudicaule]|uniref:F-box domain-containing protein n=1 Tax=Papaver nudicaule TaxID=74823 RepID=A0AA41SF24_PAPNU|nr:hypothetical protein [Papaver nudicaule]